MRMVSLQKSNAVYVWILKKWKERNINSGKLDGLYKKTIVTMFKIFTF